MAPERDAALLHGHYTSADRIMFGLSLFLFAASLGLATWYGTWAEAVVIGGATIAAQFLILKLAAGEPLARAAMGIGIMIFACLHIHQAHGMIEFHFGIFALLAVLLYYRDWLPIVCAAITVAIHHVALYAAQRAGTDLWVLPSDKADWWIIGIHAAYVVVESAILIWLAGRARTEATQGLELTESIRLATQNEQIDLSRETSGRGDVLQRFNSFLEALRALVADSQSIGDVLYQEGQRLSLSTGGISHRLAEQRASIDSVSNATEELATTSGALAEDAQQNGSTVERVALDSARALAAGNRNAEALARLRTEFETTTNVIDTLNRESASVSRVLDVIRAVAEQTNLLALNAAIEAARAGDQGRGFAVVAGEVRALARQSQEAADDIGQIIDSLQQRSEAAVQATANSHAQLQACLEQNGEVLEIIKTNESAAQTLKGVSERMVAATEDQGRASEEINRAISDLLGGAEKTSKDSDEAASTGRELERQAEQLKQLLTRFA